MLKLWPNLAILMLIQPGSGQNKKSIINSRFGTLLIGTPVRGLMIQILCMLDWILYLSR